MSVHRSLTAAILLALAAATLTGSPSSAGGKVAGPVRGDGAGSDAIEVRIRQTFGLDSSAEHRKAVGAQGSRSVILGIPTSPQEDLEMERRGRSGEAIGSFTASERIRDPRNYAGGYLDQLHGGVVVLAYRRVPSEAHSRAVEHFPRDAKISLAQSAHSLQQLESVQSLVRLKMREYRDRGIKVQSGGVDVEHNVVAVSIAADSAAGAERQLQASYGDAIMVRRSQSRSQAQDRTYQFPNYRAGQRMVAPPSTECTMGFSTASNSDSKIWLVTAGHCAAADSPWYEGTAYGNSIGPTHSHRWFDNTYCDCGLTGDIGIRGINGVYLTDPTTQYIGRVADQYGDYQGMPLTMSGARNSTCCGGSGHIVTGKVFACCGAFYYDSISRYTINDVGQVASLSASPIGGDSGAPWYSGDLAVGIHSGHESAYAYYAHVWRLPSQLNVHVITYNP